MKLVARIHQSNINAARNQNNMEWINEVLKAKQAGFPVLGATFLLGIISVFSCGCNYSIIGTVVGYSGSLGTKGKARSIVLSSLFFLMGIIVSMSALGCLIGYASEFVSSSFAGYWRGGAGLISIVFGLYTIDLFPFKIPGISVNYNNSNKGTGGAVLFGFVIGGLTALCGLCCSPFLPVIMAATFVGGSTVWGILMLLSYSLGYGLTMAVAMMGISLGVGKISGSVQKLADVLKYASGIALILLGFYFLLTI